jgi:hypothetical protein
MTLDLDAWQRLDALHQEHSWRRLQETYFAERKPDGKPVVTFQTLNKIWRTRRLPKDRVIRAAVLQGLGLEARKAEDFPGQRKIRRKIAKMRKETERKVLVTR